MLILILLFCSANILAADLLAVRNVTLIDGTGAAPSPNMTVLVSGGTITAIGSGLRIPASSTVVDGSGKYLIPGLWDSHVHLWESKSMFPLYLAAGVTTVRDMGSDLRRTIVRRNEPLAPRVFTSGSPIDGRASANSKLPVIPVTTAEQAQKAVSELFDQDIDFLKVLSSLPHDAYIAAAYRARTLRLPFTGHLPDEVTAWEAIDQRQRSMEHLFGITLACSQDEESLRERWTEAIRKHDRAAQEKIGNEVYDTFDAARAKKLFERFARFDVFQTPTLTLWARMTLVDTEKLASEPALQYVPAGIRKEWTNPLAELKKASAKDLENGRKSFERALQITGSMKKSGVSILAGTDTGDDYVVPGFALHDELELLTRAGLTPMEALQSATRNAARVVDAENRLGTVQKGRVADMVLLNADPLKDIANTRAVEAVVLRGRLLTHKQLQDGLMSLK